jgi:hypothetical protein
MIAKREFLFISLLSLLMLSVVKGADMNLTILQTPETSKTWNSSLSSKERLETEVPYY